MIDLDDYVSEEEKKAIAIEEFRRVAAKKCELDFERILSNASYSLVQKVVDDAFDGGMVATVKAKSIEIINALSSFTVFKKPDAWDRGESKGWSHLQAAIDEAKPVIQERVNAVIADLSDEDLRELISDRITDAVLSKLSK